MNPALPAFLELKVFDGIGDIYLRSINPRLRQRAIQQSPRGSHERTPHLVLLIARLFADKNDRRRSRPLASHRPCGSSIQVATTAILLSFPQERKSLVRRNEIG